MTDDELTPDDEPTPEVTVTVRAHTQVNVDGTVHEGGATVTVSAETAAEWLKAGFVTEDEPA